MNLAMSYGGAPKMSYGWCRHGSVGSQVRQLL